MLQLQFSNIYAIQRKVSRYQNTQTIKKHCDLRQRKPNSPGKAIVIVCGQSMTNETSISYVSTILTILVLKVTFEMG